MKCLNLINQSESEVGYKLFSFPDGEPHIVLEELDRKEAFIVLCRITCPSDLFILLQVGNILNRQGILFALGITYLMSMRMDRVISYNEAYSLEIVASLINSLNAFKVVILDPHSDKTCFLIKNSEPSDLDTPDNPKVICFPDKGAKDRYEKRYPGRTILYCSKVRDLETGKIEYIKIENPEVYSGGDICVVDDLCDAGGTFALLAPKLRELAPDAKISVYVTHMVNPKGIKTLSTCYDYVTITDSYADWESRGLPENVECVSIK